MFNLLFSVKLILTLYRSRIVSRIMLLSITVLIFNLVPLFIVSIRFDLFFLDLNMFLVPQVSVNFGISPSSKLYTNLVLHISKCVNLVLLTKFC